MPPAAFRFPPPPPFDFTRRPLALGPDDLLPPGEVPDHSDVRLIPAAVLPRVRFARPDRALAAAQSLSRCALEPDRRSPLPPGLVDVFTLPGRFRLLSLERTSEAVLQAWLGGEAHDGIARDDDEFVLILDREVAAVLRRIDLRSDLSPLLSVDGSVEVLRLYPQDGRWIIESTFHQQIRLHLRNPSPSET
jgi:hypothetical protein